jgi:hypothetical protein
MRYLFLFLSFLTVGAVAQPSQTILSGHVSDKNNQPLAMVNVSVKQSHEGTVTDANGFFSLPIPPGDSVVVQFTYVGYKEKEITLSAKAGDSLVRDVQMVFSSTVLPDVIIEDKSLRQKSISSISSKAITKLPGMSTSVESLVKTMPGVASNNEMSNQYSVRGGNFDENLVYVNDIRIYRPFLVRSGRQEGLSFVNSDLVSNILFSAGGFDARYGDKMSSVLDITYKNPQHFSGSVTASLLGASGHLEGRSKNQKWGYLLGVRQKSNQYVLNSLQTEGEYRPSFTDVQAMAIFEPNEQWKFMALGNITNNVYRFVPETRTTDFGTFQEALRLNVYFDGQEHDRYEGYTAGLSSIFKPFGGLTLKFITSAYQAYESETYDILGEYWIGQLNTNFGSDEFGEVLQNQGVGAFLDHARNYLDVQVLSAAHKGHYITDRQELEWGLQYRHEQITDEMKEWSLLDSAGYTLPYPPQTPGHPEPVHAPLEMSSVVKANHRVSSNRISAFGQITWDWEAVNASYALTTGLRASYWDYNDEILISPRATFSVKPSWKQDILFRLSSGIYYQPPFYKEMRNMDGSLVVDPQSQRSVHVVLGSDWNFVAWERPFKFITELFYKKLDHLVPYEVDNVRIRYYADQEAKGYSTGIDMKINGEFVPGVESWASLSFMKSEENITGDYYLESYNESGELITAESADQEVAYTKEVPIGYRPRPTDQRVNFSLFFQDYLPRNPSYKMHLNLLYGTGLPVDIPGSKNYKGNSRIPSYRRVDIGFSKQIVGEGTRLRQGHFLNNLESMWISLEVFNLLQIKNTISYFWVTDINERRLAVPNYLTPRQVNLKLHVTF